MTIIRFQQVGFALLALAIGVGLANKATAQEFWNVDDSGNWTDDTKWTLAHPNGLDQMAFLSFDITDTRAVTLDAPITLGALTIGDPSGNSVYNLSGTNTLTFEVSSGNASLTKSGLGNNTISTAILLNDNLDIHQPSGVSTLTVLGVISGNFGINRLDGPDGVSGPRFVLDNANNSYTGDTIITAGRLRTRTLTGSIPNGAGKGNVIIGELGGLELTLPNGGNDTINGLSGSGFVVHGGPSPAAMTLTVGDNDATGFVFSGTIQLETPLDPQSRKLNFAKIGTGVQSLSGNNTYNGTTTINGGTLLVNGTHSDPVGIPGAYTVKSGATLGGIGNIDADVVLSNGGIVSPGTDVGASAVGTLTINSLAVSAQVTDYNTNSRVDAADYVVWRDTLTSNTDLRANGDNTGDSTGVIDQADYSIWTAQFGQESFGTLAIDIDESSASIADKLVVEGTLDLSNLTLAFDVAGSLTQSEYVFASYVSLNGTFASDNTPLGYVLDYNYLSGNQIALVSTGGLGSGSAMVPEPTSWMLLLIAGLTVFAARWRR